MGCVLCLDHAASRAREDPEVDGSRLSPAGRRGEPLGISRRSTRALSIPRKENPMSHHASGPNFGFPRGDARLDMTDLYAFPKPGDPAKSIIVLNVHPSFRLDSPEPTTQEPFAPGALYEIKIDTNGDLIADICYSVQFASGEDGRQTATVRCLRGVRAAGVGEEGELIVQQAAVSVGKDALVTKAGDYNF